MSIFVPRGLGKVAIAAAGALVLLAATPGTSEAQQYRRHHGGGYSGNWHGGYGGYGGYGGHWRGPGYWPGAAIGAGVALGVGLGASIEKLQWLPEAHTDFLMAVIGEEFGLAGVLLIIAMFMWMTRRIMHIGRQSIALDRLFAGLVAQGIGLWIGFQTFINIGVNLGALPTKGLTLPLMSYGGSAIVMNLISLAVVLRIDYENRLLMRGGRV